MKKIINKKNTKNSIVSKKEKLLEGALVGAVLGVAAGMLLSPESGKKLREDIKKLPGDFYRYMAPRVKKLKKVGEKQYDAFVDEGVKNYVKAKKLSVSEEKMLKNETRRFWKNIKKHL